METLFLVTFVCCIILLIITIVLYLEIKKLRDELNKIKNIYIIPKLGFFRTIFDPILDLYRKFNFILYLFVAIFFYVLASFDLGGITIFTKYFISADTISNIFTSIATVILSSGVFSAITKSKHFLTIFSDEMKKIVYTNEFLSKQKNIEDIWTTVTKSVCNENFQGISDKLFNSIKQNYLPINQNFYYEDFDLEIHIDHINNSETFLSIKEITKVNLISDTVDEIEYSYTNCTYFDDATEHATIFKVDNFVVNSENRMNDLEVIRTIDDTIKKTQMKCKLSGSTTYEILREETKVYSLRLNPSRVHSALKIYNKFKLAIYYPESVIVRFSNLGYNSQWDNVQINKIGNGMKYLKTTHDGIFFQNQGYMLNYLLV